MLEVRVLGGLAAVVDGRPVRLPADARARELLGWLVVAPGRTRGTRAFWDAAVPYTNGQTYFNFPGLFEQGDAALRAGHGARRVAVLRLPTRRRAARRRQCGCRRGRAA